MYSIQSKLSLVFIAAGLIYFIGVCFSFYFSGQVFSTTQLFLTTTLPRIKTTSSLQQTAFSIEEETQELSHSNQNKELTDVHNRLVMLLDYLETLTATISQDSIAFDIDVLSLNSISQAIRSQSQLVYQLKAEQLRFIRKARGHYHNVQRELVRLLTPDFVPNESNVLIDSRHDELHDSILDLMSHLNGLEMAQTLIEIHDIQEGYKKSCDKLFKTIRTEKPTRYEQLLLVTRKLLAEMDLMFDFRIQRVQIEKSNGKFIFELKNLVRQLTQISTEYVAEGFANYSNNAQQVIQNEREILWIRLCLVFISIVLLYILYKHIVIRGLSDKLTLISRAMIDVPGRDNQKIILPTQGKDEIADMARTVEILLEKSEKLKKMATIDELTQINNRRSFFEIAERERDRAIRMKTATSIIMMDLDHFKTINDRFGHAFGDKVLYEFAQTSKKFLRANDVFARYGGEEFVLLMSDTSLEKGRIVAERIRKATEEIRLTTDDNRAVQLSVSLGLTEAALGSVTVEQAVKQADEALYQAKNQGRNRVLSWNEAQTNC